MHWFRFGLVLLLVMFLKVMFLFGRSGFCQNRSLKQIAQIFDQCLLLCVFINTHALQENVNIDLFVQSLYNMYHHDRSLICWQKKSAVYEKTSYPFSKTALLLGGINLFIHGKKWQMFDSL